MAAPKSAKLRKVHTSIGPLRCQQVGTACRPADSQDHDCKTKERERMASATVVALEPPKKYWSTITAARLIAPIKTLRTTI